MVAMGLAGVVNALMLLVATQLAPPAAGDSPVVGARRVSGGSAAAR